MSHRRAPVVALLLAVSLAACRGPTPPHPLEGAERYLCCNLRYERTKITDVNYLRGTLVPIGTPVRIVEVDRNSVTFAPANHPELTLVLRYGRPTLTMDEYLARLFRADDPRTALVALPKNVRAKIEQGIVEPGMTRAQVLMSLGYPPAHRTPSLDSATWIYWANRWATLEVLFDGDRVSRVR